MSIIDTLITDRTQSDITRWRTLHDKGWANMTADEKAEWTAGMKGAYNATDLNRVNDALIYLRDLFGGFGFSADIKLPVITDVTPGTIEPGESRLPDGYTELEYIESSGTQYIDTGFKPNQDTKIEVKFQTEQAQQGGICVAATAWVNNGFGIFVDTSLYGNSNLGVVNHGPEPITCVLDKNTLYQGESVIGQFNASEFQVSYNLFILAWNQSNSPVEFTVGKLYSCKIHDNDVLIRDFIPCKNPLGSIGLYDLENDLFYGNSGTGKFIAGPEIIPEPIITPPVITTRTNWTIKDIPTSQQMNEYLTNVETIRSMMSNIPIYPSGWQSPPNTPETMQHLTYEQANDIERILTDINDLLVWVSNNLVWVFAGDVYAGEW